MKTRYILHGGNINGSADKGKAFFEAIVSGLRPQPKLLLCYYARPREGWEQLFNSHNEAIGSFWTEKPTLEMANPETYADQAQRNDAIIMFGGDSDLLYYRLNMSPASLDPWKGKTIAGSSAGAQALVDKYYSLSWRKVRDGMNILSENLLVHYQSTYGSDDPRGPIDWIKAEQELQQAAGSNEKVIKLQENQFVTIEQ